MFFRPIRAATDYVRLRQFWKVVGLMPCRRAGALTLPSLRCTDRRTASVVLSLPHKAVPIAPPATHEIALSHCGIKHLEGAVDRHHFTHSEAMPLPRPALMMLAF